MDTSKLNKLIVIILLYSFVTSCYDRQKDCDCEKIIGLDSGVILSSKETRNNLKDMKIQHLRNGKIIENISFSIKKGEIVGIIGHSGEGKSTLMKALSGHLPITSGKIYLDSIVLPHASSLLIPGFKNVSIVHQDFKLSIYNSVESNIRSKIASLSKEIQDKWIEDLLGMVDLKGKNDQKVITLSGGEQQRLAIICALAEENDVLLLDEPFVHMHSAMRSRLVSYLIQLNKIRQTSMVLVSHHGDELLGLCNRLLILKKGKVYRISTPEKLFNQPKTVYEAEFFGAYNKIRYDEKWLFFRPNEYVLENSGEEYYELHVDFKNAVWHGCYWNNYFDFEGKELILFNFEPLNGIKKIYIPKK